MKNWNYPAQVLAIFDDKKGFDHYTIIYKPFFYRGMEIWPYVGSSDNPQDPQGFFQYGEFKNLEAVDYIRRNYRYKISFDQLPENVKKAVLADIENE